jgi:hypothetical protein
MTHFMFHISADQSMANFAFGTIVGYNFVKYDALARPKKMKRLKSLPSWIFSLSSIGYYFFQLQLITQIVSVGVLGLTLLYTFLFLIEGMRVTGLGSRFISLALCWVGVTLGITC